MCLVSEWASVV